jgi:hypothetical protein
MRELITYIIEQKCDICTVYFHYHITAVHCGQNCQFFVQKIKAELLQLKLHSFICMINVIDKKVGN